jgi:uroporphyrin-3 C-methyltransferase
VSTAGVDGPVALPAADVPAAGRPTVLVTRPPAQADEWVDLLRSRGLDAVALPLIGIDTADPAPIDAAWAALDTWRLLVFVSPNAVAGWFARRPPGRPWPDTLRAASPGPGTSAALREAGVPDACLLAPAPDAAQFDSESLWETLRGHDWQGARVLVVRGEGGREWLSERLREAGARVEAVGAYRRVAPTLTGPARAALHAALQAPVDHVWLFSSSEAIGHLPELAGLGDAALRAALASATAIATHPRIAARAREAGFGTVRDCRPDADAVVACLQSGSPSRPVPGPDTSRTVSEPIPPAAALPPAPPPPAAVPPAVVPPAVTPRAAPTAELSQRAAAPRPWARGPMLAGLAVVATALLLGAVGASLGWRAQQRLKALEGELVRRQQDSQQQATEARLLAQQAQEGLREAAAKVSILEARLSEVAVQRSQLEDLIQSLSRSRDENIVVDIESALRVAQQQSALSGSAEPLVAVLRQSDDRLARYNQPRLESVRRAIARDLDRVRRTGMADIGALAIKLDEAVRMVDDLPMLSSAEPRSVPTARTAAPPPSAASVPLPAAGPTWLQAAVWEQAATRVWAEVRSLVRVTRIQRPEAILLAPEQAYFLRENLKLRLLNARLALLSRQFDTAQVDLQVATETIERYHDRSSRRTQLTQELLRQVINQARQATLPRPDDTLAALAAVSAVPGR